MWVVHYGSKSKIVNKRMYVFKKRGKEKNKYGMLV